MAPDTGGEHLQRSYLTSTNWLSEYYLQQGDYTQAIQLCRKILALDICFEEAHCRLMRCYEAQGRRHLVARQYQICTKTLKTELDVPPSVKTATLYDQLIDNSGCLSGGAPGNFRQSL